jgi:hypothetical protein
MGKQLSVLSRMGRVGMKAPVARARGLVLTAMLAVLLVGLAVSQMPQPNNGMPGPGRNASGFPALPDVANPRPDGVRALRDSMNQPDIQKRIRELNALRQRELNSDTAKLLILIKEVKVDVDKVPKDHLSMNDVMEVEQIEKLAKSVQAKMKAQVGN